MTRSLRICAVILGAMDSEHPEYQLGDGCLVDQLMGQYLADVAGLGELVSRKNMASTLRAIYGSNYKRYSARA